MFNDKIETKPLPCPHCNEGEIRATYGIRTEIQECTKCSLYLRITANACDPDISVGKPLYQHRSSIELAALKTLESKGYTYHGGELWKPPLGGPPDYIKDNEEE